MGRAANPGARPDGPTVPGGLTPWRSSTCTRARACCSATGSAFAISTSPAATRGRPRRRPRNSPVLGAGIAGSPWRRSTHEDATPRPGARPGATGHADELACPNAGRGLHDGRLPRPTPGTRRTRASALDGTLPRRPTGAAGYCPLQPTLFALLETESAARILARLLTSPSRFYEVVAAAQRSPSATAQHLRRLRGLELVEGNGRHGIVRLIDERRTCVAASLARIPCNHAPEPANRLR